MVAECTRLDWFENAEAKAVRGDRQFRPKAKVAGSSPVHLHQIVMDCNAIAI